MFTRVYTRTEITTRTIVMEVTAAGHMECNAKATVGGMTWVCQKEGVNILSDTTEESTITTCEGEVV